MSRDEGGVSDVFFRIPTCEIDYFIKKNEYFSFHQNRQSYLLFSININYAF